MEGLSTSNEKFVELPRKLIVERLMRFQRQGTDPVLLNLLTLLVPQLTRSEDPTVTAVGIYIALTTGCLCLGKKSSEARAFLPLLVDDIEKIQHPNAVLFAKVVREGLPGISQSQTPKLRPKLDRRQRAYPIKKRDGR